MCFAPQRRALFRHRNFQKWSEHGVFCTCWLRNVLRATTACTFLTSQLPKVVRAWCVLNILTSKYASSKATGWKTTRWATTGTRSSLRGVHSCNAPLVDLCSSFGPRRRSLDTKTARKGSGWAGKLLEFAWNMEWLGSSLSWGGHFSALEALANPHTKRFANLHVQVENVEAQSKFLRDIPAGRFMVSKSRSLGQCLGTASMATCSPPTPRPRRFWPGKQKSQIWRRKPRRRLFCAFHSCHAESFLVPLMYWFDGARHGHYQLDDAGMFSSIVTVMREVAARISCDYCVEYWVPQAGIWGAGRPMVFCAALS